VPNTSALNWVRDIDADQWDRILASFGGHPLQSALWGASRRSAEGIEDRRWAAFSGDAPAWFARFEIRRLPLHGRVAWLPRGPVYRQHSAAAAAQRQFLDLLRQDRFLLCFSDPYLVPNIGDSAAIELGTRPRTLCVDLAQGKDVVFGNMHKKLRYGVRAAERAGVALEETRRAEDVHEFYRLCNLVSSAKQFDLPGTEALMQELIARGRADSAVRAHLFVARYEGRLVSGYLSIRVGERLHNIWNSTDRAYARQCPGEAVLWHQVAWAIDSGVRAYDQEGIDESNNPGCYQFKKRLGGEELELPGLRAYPLGSLGRVALKLGQLAGKF
jgi:lipid II:glycine glycyltransferase (peptidoglycan interpeptide bridge formation enzyme)